jgi:hypothetical protein
MESGCRSDTGKSIEWARRIGSVMRIGDDAEESGGRIFDEQEGSRAVADRESPKQTDAVFAPLPCHRRGGPAEHRHSESRTGPL